MITLNAILPTGLGAFEDAAAYAIPVACLLFAVVIGIGIGLGCKCQQERKIKVDRLDQ